MSTGYYGQTSLGQIFPDNSYDFSQFFPKVVDLVGGSSVINGTYQVELTDQGCSTVTSVSDLLTHSVMVCGNIFNKPSFPNHKSKRADILREGSPSHSCHVSGVTCHMSHITSPPSLQ